MLDGLKLKTRDDSVGNWQWDRPFGRSTTPPLISFTFKQALRQACYVIDLILEILGQLG
jgi:hypothetical protein